MASRTGLIPAIALAAHTRDLDRTVVINAGFQHHLSKPVDPVELVATINSLLGINRTLHDR